MSGQGTPVSIVDGSGNVQGSSGNPINVNQGALDSAKDTVSLASTRATTIFNVTAPALDTTSSSSQAVLYIQGAAALVEHLVMLRLWCHATAAADIACVLRRATAIPVAGTKTALAGNTTNINDTASSAVVAYYTAKPNARGDTTIFSYAGSIPAANSHPKVPIDLVPTLEAMKDFQLISTSDILTLFFTSFPAGFACDGITVILTEGAT